MSFILESKALTPWEICEIMKTGFESVKSQYFLQKKEFPFSSNFYAIVRGKIFTDKPKISQMDPTLQVVLSKKIDEPIFSNSKKIFPKEQVIEEIQKNKFYIQTPGNGHKKQMLMYFHPGLDYQKALTILNE